MDYGRHYFLFRSLCFSIHFVKDFQMITSEKFDKLKYHFIKNGFPGKEIESLLGLDSEALTTGAPFLFCVSDGRAIKPFDLLPTLLDKYNKKDFALWNLKYDSGAILYDMPPGAIIYEEDGETIKRFTPGKYELWTTNKTTWLLGGVEYIIEYIPHKYLKVFLSKYEYVKFWDICQFYASGLDAAAKKYLNEGKDDIETKSFTPEYVAVNYKKIKKYCAKDAKLTADLGNYLLKKLDEFGLRVTALYSQASISFRYFQDNGEIIGVPRYYKNYPDFLRVVMDSYEGGKFEITSRGYHPSIYEFDITSAYPFEIANLANIDRADIMRSTIYQQDCYYAFLRIHVKIYESVNLPCGVMTAGTRVYPVGEFFITVTKNEYLYLLEVGAEVEILDGWYLFIKNPEFPYRENIQKLFTLKSQYKGKDSMLYMLTKIMMNGFYGKTCQVIENWKGEHEAGVGFNPVYASIITANTRLKVARIQNRYKEKCLAVHTDSVLLTCPLDDALVFRDTLGEFERVGDGPEPGVIVACGCYQIGDSGAFKGFEPREKKSYGGMIPDREKFTPSANNPSLGGKCSLPKEYETWFDILKEYAAEKEIPYNALRVESWVEATSKGHFDKINKFEYHPKNIDLNSDVKRLWHSKDMTAGDYLKRLYKSDPVVLVETEPPSYWKLPRHSKRKLKKWTCKKSSGTGPESRPLKSPSVKSPGQETLSKRNRKRK